MKSIFEKVIRGADNCPVFLSVQPIKNGKLLNGVRAQTEFVKNVFQSTVRQIPHQEILLTVDSTQAAATLLQYNKKMADLNQKASYFVIHKETGDCLGMMNVYCQGKQTAEIYFMMTQKDDRHCHMREGLKLLENSFLGRLGFEEIITNMAWDLNMHRLWLMNGCGYQKKESYQGRLLLGMQVMGNPVFETYAKTRETFLQERQPKGIRVSQGVSKMQERGRINGE